MTGRSRATSRMRPSTSPSRSAAASGASPTAARKYLARGAPRRRPPGGHRRGQRVLHLLGRPSQTFRQVYFEDELSAAAKYDYAIASGLAGVGIWTLDNDRGYTEMYDVIRAKFYDPTHRVDRAARRSRRSACPAWVRPGQPRRCGSGTPATCPRPRHARLADLRPARPPAQEGLVRLLTCTPAGPEDRHDHDGHRLGSAPAARHLHAEGPVRLKGGIWKTAPDRFRQPY